MDSFFSIETITELTASQWFIIMLICLFFVAVLSLFYIHRRNNLKRMDALKEQLELQLHSQGVQQDERMQRFKDGLHNHLNEISTRLNATENKVSALANLFYEYANEPEEAHEKKKESTDKSTEHQQESDN
jgi:cbb3-type cytochrome oxidase subunit 3